jgi:hypothetical protein
MDAVPPGPLAATPPVKVEPPLPGWLPSEPHKIVTVFALATPTTSVKSATKNIIFFIVVVLLLLRIKIQAYFTIRSYAVWNRNATKFPPSLGIKYYGRRWSSTDPPCQAVK